MSPHSTEARPLFDVAIDCLMASSSCRLGPAVGFVHDHVFVSTRRIPSATTITLNHFSRQEPVLQVATEDGEIGPSSAFERPVDPAKVSSLNADTHLMPHASFVALVQAPFPAERDRLADPEICTIHRHLARPALSCLNRLLSLICIMVSKNVSNQNQKEPTTRAMIGQNRWTVGAKAEGPQPMLCLKTGCVHQVPGKSAICGRATKHRMKSPSSFPQCGDRPACPN